MSLGGLAGGILGATIGFFAGGPAGAQYGWMIGSTAGSILTQKKPPDLNGPRLENLKTTTSGYGQDIPTVYGTAMVGGKYICSTDLIERVTRTKVSSGGLFGKSQYQVNYSYSINCAVAFSRGVGKVVKLYADGQLVSNIDLKELASQPGVGFFKLLQMLVTRKNQYNYMKAYDGTSTQTADPVVESIVGAGNASGFRDIVYVVLQNFELEKFGNRPPQFTALISSVDPTPTGLIQTAQSYVEANPSGTANDDFLWKFHLLGTVNESNLAVPVAIDYQMRMFDDLYSTSGTIRSAMSWSPGVITQDGSAYLYAVYNEPQKIYSTALGPGSVLVGLRWYDAMGQGGKLEQDLILLNRYPLRIGASNVLFRPGTAGGAAYLVSPDNRPIICQTLEFTNGQRAYGDNLWFCALDERSSGKLANEMLIPINTAFATSWSNTSDADGIALLGNHLYFVINRRDLIYHNLATGEQIDTGINNQSVNPGGDPWVSCWIDDDYFYYLYYAGVSNQLRLATIAHGNGTPVSDVIVTSASISSHRYGAAPLQRSGRYLYGIRAPAAITTTGDVYRLDLEAASPSPEILGTITWSPNLTTMRVGIRLDRDQGMLRVWNNVSDILYSYWYAFGFSYDDTVSLADIIADQCEKSGLAPADYDVSDLAGIDVSGFVLDRKMSAKSVLEQLMTVFQISVQQADGVLKFIDLSNVDVITVPEDDLQLENEDNGRLPYSTIPDAELPRAIDFSFIDPDREYEVNTVRALRGSSLGEEITTVNVPVVLTAAEAAERVDVMLSTAWVQRRTYSGSIPWKYLEALPAAVLDTTYNGIQHRILLTHISVGDRIGFQGIGYEAATLSNAAAAGDAGTGQLASRMGFSGPTLIEFLDINPLQAQDVGPGYYIAVSGVLPDWRGCLLYRSINNGETFEAFDTFVEGCIFAHATTVLPTGPVDIFDTASTLTIRVNGVGTPTSAADDLAVLNGANLAVVGNEIIQFRDVTSLGNGIYQLSYLLRGKQGTESERTNHFLGERVVIIKSGGIRFVPAALADINTERRFIAQSQGQVFDPESYQAYTWTGRILKPFTVHDVNARRDGSANLTVSWIRRNRLNNALLDFIAGPLDEETQEYDVDIMNGSTVLKTYNSVTNSGLFTLGDRTVFIYSSANQTTDGVPTPSSISMRIYQKSAAIGRGHELQVTV